MIAQALTFLPLLSYILLAAVWILTEIVSYLHRRRPAYDDPYTNRFRPPFGDGYEYYVSATHTVYIHTRSPREFRVYILKGDPPAHTKRDRYGRYFTVNADVNTVEGVVERVFATTKKAVV